MDTISNNETELILSIVIAASTVLYTLINIFLWIESIKTRKQKITPLIVAFLKSTENHIMLELHLKNIGEGVARNVRINVLEDYYRLKGNKMPLSEIGIVENGFNNFPPQYELKFYLNSLVELYEENKDGKIVLEISYERIDKRKFKNIYELPFNQIYGQNYSSPPDTYLGQIPYYLKEINSTLKDKVKLIK